MKVGSLFSGIGGLDLGLERAGMTVAWQSEIDPYACRVLAKHWPDVPNLGDVTKIEWSSVERVDLICGGYPCQPFSLAGVRRGEGDHRHLWPRFADALRHLRPRFALLENVPGHLSLGLGRVLGDLAEVGYDTIWDCVPAAAVGAPHRRDRLFVVAHPRGYEWRDEPFALPRRSGPTAAGDDGEEGMVADADGRRFQVGPQLHGETSWSNNRSPRRHAHRLRDQVADPDRSRLEERRQARSTHNGDHWAAEPDVGRVADGVPHRVDRLRVLGNAVVPQVAEHIGRRLMEAAA